MQDRYEFGKAGKSKLIKGNGDIIGSLKIALR